MPEHMGRPTRAEETICDVAEKINLECCKPLDSILLDLSDGKLDMSLGQLAATIALVDLRLRDVLRLVERAGAPTRPG